MAKPIKTFSWLITFSGWFSSVFPTLWGGMLTAAGATILLWLTAGAKVFSSPNFIGACLTFFLIFWTYIGVVWLSYRRRPVTTVPFRDYRYGLTFQGLMPSLDLNNEDGALQMSIVLQNYSHGALKYRLEAFDLRIDTRSLPASLDRPVSNFMSRGATRSIALAPFKKAHIQEFLSKRQDATMSFSLLYGDVEELNPSRRLKMSFQIVFIFPPDISLPLTGRPRFGFNSVIEKEATSR